VGDLTTAEVADSFTSSGTPDWINADRGTFDNLGRKLTDEDPLGNTTSTSYTPANGGALTQTVSSNAVHQATTIAYDALGRVSKVWGRRDCCVEPHVGYCCGGGQLTIVHCAANPSACVGQENR
jgi:hypothetical protein